MQGCGARRAVVADRDAPGCAEHRTVLRGFGESTTAAGGHGGHGGTEMDGLTQDQAMSELSGRSGTDADRRFLELMTAHHQGAVTMARDELANGQNVQARELAQKIIDDQQAEISEMQQLHQRL